jgi:hypothetical protein
MERAKERILCHVNVQQEFAGMLCCGTQTSEHSVLPPMAVCNDTAPAALTADHVEIDICDTTCIGLLSFASIGN